MYYYTVVIEIKKRPYGSILGSHTDPRTTKTFVNEKIVAEDDDEARTIAREKELMFAVGNVSSKVTRIWKERHEIPKEKPGLNEKGH